MHIICVILLFTSRFSCMNGGGSSINFSSICKILTVPVYFFMIFRVEVTLRKYRTAYVSGSENHHFQFGKWKDSSKSGGSTCFFKDKQNGIFWLWLEIYAFGGQVLSILFDLFISFFNNTLVKEPKNPDYILIKDYRQFNFDGSLQSENKLPVRAQEPKYYVFDSNLS